MDVDDQVQWNRGERGSTLDVTAAQSRSKTPVTVALLVNSDKMVKRYLIIS